MAAKTDKSDGGKLSLNASWSMAVGGMIGGGIFATLGVVFDTAGAFAPVAFLIGGLIALATAHSYAELTRHHDKSGGVFIYLHQDGHETVARVSVWVLLAGYTLTVAVYAYTFGAYLSDALGGPDWIKPAAAVASIAILAGVNLMGVKESAGVEIFVVWAKLIILLALAVIGIAHWAPDNLQVTGDGGGGQSPFLGAIVGAASVFMAYEGFQLLSYDYEEMEKPKRDIGRGMILAVAAVIVVYILVAVGTGMLIGADKVIAEKEVSLAIAGRAAAGEVGFIAVAIAALFSTASAVNATIFSTARLTKRASELGEMPDAFDKTNSAGVPWFGTVLIAVVAGVLALFGGLDPLVKAASLVFLAIFAIVNLISIRKDAGIRWISVAGLIGAVASAIVLVIHFFGVV
ncbi:APC family permease [Erythrobacter sp. LQ02-29]|uniref:APC family permease n=1 Tax=Erythrobacter sp. LQ02-29 TaxID=2920384 RepID=UPI001F4D4771|nr:APC family permease [Erythrobacter sp. LQ02-29]MCP9222982.1 APC family permease [Erythrobacter sp. LQ02-29]